MQGRTQPRQPFWASVLRLPLFLLLIGVFSAAMLVPAVYGGIVRDLVAARAFLYSGLLGLVTFALIGLAHAGRDPRHGTLGPLLSLMSAFVILPAVLAVPFHEGLRTTTFLNAYVEMVSAITTTGATMFDNPERLNGTLHLWRSIVGWLGGLMMWVAASAILAPLNLGGFEVTARAEPGRSASRDIGMTGPEVRERLVQGVGSADPDLCRPDHAALGASGRGWRYRPCRLVSCDGDPGDVRNFTGWRAGWRRLGHGGRGGDAVVHAVCPVTSDLFTDTTTAESGGLVQDPEFRIGVAVVIAVPVFLFLRHFLGAFDVAAERDVIDAARALWGSAFTVLAFLTTTGFASANWVDAQAWSGWKPRACC